MTDVAVGGGCKGLYRQDEYPAAANYEVSADDISAVSTCTVQVTDAKGTQLAACNLTVVQIGHTWYVDNTTADTSALYQIGK